MVQVKRVQSGKYTTVGYATEERHGQWLGDDAGYQSIHIWLRRHHGRADHCCNPECPGVPNDYKWFEWALKKGEVHGHDISRYQPMCRSCHRIYDGINRKDK